MDKSKRFNTTIRFDVDIREFLREKSFKECISISDIVNNTIRDYMTKQK